jgi:hypothetical protein
MIISIKVDVRMSGLFFSLPATDLHFIVGAAIGLRQSSDQM